MKTLALAVTALALSLGTASAQQAPSRNNTTYPGLVAADVTGFRAPATLGPQKSQSSKFPNIRPDLRPQFGGVLVDSTKYGAQLVNPAAPASYGYGAKYLSAPSGRADLLHESGPAAHHDAGGIKFLSFEF